MVLERIERELLSNMIKKITIKTRKVTEDFEKCIMIPIRKKERKKKERKAKKCKEHRIISLISYVWMILWKILHKWIKKKIVESNPFHRIIIEIFL